MTVAFPAIVRKQSRLMTPPPRSHPPIAKRRWTRKGEGGNDVISCILVIIYTVACYELCCVCVFSCRRQKSTESAGSDEEDVDELTLIDHKEIMSRITLKQEVSWCSWFFNECAVTELRITSLQAGFYPVQSKIRSSDRHL